MLGLRYLVALYGGPLQVLYYLGIRKHSLRHKNALLALLRELFPGFAVRGTSFIFRVCEELHIAFCHPCYMKVSLPRCSTMTALRGASKQLNGSSSESEQIPARVEAGEPGWGLGVPLSKLGFSN